MAASTSVPRRAVILAAGLGSRLGARTSQLPKCLVPVNGVPILVNALDCLGAAGVGDAIVVIGYHGDEVRRRIGEESRGLRVSYRENSAYRTSGTSRSLWIALDGLDEDVLILEGDVVFEPRTLANLLGAPAVDATLVQRWNPSLDGSVVQRRADGTVSAWIHAKDRPAGFSPAGTFKTINIHRISRAFLRARLWPALEAQVARDGGCEPIETVFASIVHEGGRIHAVEAHGRWVEVDDERDLRLAEEMFQEAAHADR